MTFTDISFKLYFDLETKKVWLKDYTDYAANGYSAGGHIEGRIQIKDPNSNYIVNTLISDNENMQIVIDTDYPYISPLYNLNLSNNEVVEGDYEVTYIINEEGTTDYYQKTKIFNYNNNDIAEINIEVEHNIYQGNILSKDLTVYGDYCTLNTRTHLLEFPDSFGSETNTSLTVNTIFITDHLYTNTYTTTIVSDVTYEFPDDLIVNATIIGSLEHVVWGNDGMYNLTTSIENLYSEYIECLDSNLKRAQELQKYLDKIQGAYILYNTYKMYGDLQKASTYLGDIKNVLVSDADISLDLGVSEEVNIANPVNIDVDNVTIGYNLNSEVELMDAAVTEEKIANENVTPIKIKSGSNNQVLVTDGTGAVAWINKDAFGAIADQVTIEGLGTTANPFVVKDLGITTSKIAENAVTNDKMANNSVGQDELINDSVTKDKVNSNIADDVSIEQTIGGELGVKDSYKQQILNENKVELFKNIFSTNTSFPTSMVLYRNEEMNNLLDPGTQIEIVSVDTNANTITLSWLPYDTTLWSPEDSNHRWLLQDLEYTSGSDTTGDYTERYQILGGDYDTKTLDYSLVQGNESNLVVGDKIGLYNYFGAFKGFERNTNNPIIDISYCNNISNGYVYLIFIFKKADGSYRMMFGGRDNGTDDRFHYFADSPDLYTWTAVNGGSPLGLGTPPSWANGVITLQSCLGKENIHGKYIYLYRTTDNSGNYSLGVCRADENFTESSIEYNDLPLIDLTDTGLQAQLASDGYSSPYDGIGVFGVSAVKVGTKYKMFIKVRPYVDSYTVAPATMVYACETEDLITCSNFELIQAGLTDSNVNKYDSKWMDTFTLFEYKSKFYAFTGGTPVHKYSGHLSARMYGLMMYDNYREDPKWINDVKNPIFINPFNYPQSIFSWENDHTGGTPLIVVDGETAKIHFFYVVGNGTDSYKIGSVIIDLENLM